MCAMVQMADVAQIRKAWIQRGTPWCAHDSYDKEYSLGSDTGDYACMTCGVCWPRGSEKPPPEPNPDSDHATY